MTFNLNVCFVPIETSLFFYKVCLAWLVLLYLCYDGRDIERMAIVPTFTQSFLTFLFIYMGFHNVMVSFSFSCVYLAKLRHQLLKH